MEETYSWYVEPMGNVAHANEVFARALGDGAERRELEDENGMPHNVWECPSYSFVTDLRKSRDTLQINFRVFSRRGNGPLRQPPFALSMLRRARDLRKTTKRPFTPRV